MMLGDADCQTGLSDIIFIILQVRASALRRPYNDVRKLQFSLN